MQKYQIIHKADLGATPAACDREKKIIYVNDKVWPTIPAEFQKVILLHEAGHLYLNTSSELLSDGFAFDKFANTEPESLKTLVNTLSNYLDLKNDSHRERWLIMAEKALENSTNKNALETLKQIKQNFMKDINYTALRDTFLKSKGVRDITKETPERQVELAIEFLKSNEMQATILNMATNDQPIESFTADDIETLKQMVENPNMEHFSFKDLLKKGVGVLSNVVTQVVNVAAKVAAPALATFGIPVSADMIAKVTNAISPINLINKAVNKNKNTSSATAQDLEAQGWLYLGNENESVLLPLNAEVAFGTNGKYLTKSFHAGDVVGINWAVFGDPIKGTPKAAWYKPTVTGQIANKSLTSPQASVMEVQNGTQIQTNANASVVPPVVPPADKTKTYLMYGGIAAVVIVILVLIFRGNKKPGKI